MYFYNGTWNMLPQNMAFNGVSEPVTTQLDTYNNEGVYAQTKRETTRVFNDEEVALLQRDNSSYSQELLNRNVVNTAAWKNSAFLAPPVSIYSIDSASAKEVYESENDYLDSLRYSEQLDVEYAAEAKRLEEERIAFDAQIAAEAAAFEAEQKRIRQDTAPYEESAAQIVPESNTSQYRGDSYSSGASSTAGKTTIGTEGGSSGLGFGV